jgi:hypothetical protein
MRKSRFTDAQIIGFIERALAGMRVADLCPELLAAEQEAGIAYSSGTITPGLFGADGIKGAWTRKALDTRSLSNFMRDASKSFGCTARSTA